MSNLILLVTVIFFILVALVVTILIKPRMYVGAAEYDMIQTIKDKISKLPITIDDLDSLPWRADSPKSRTTHIGQRKLLMTEVLFLSKCAKINDTIVYAGAAPGLHIPFLQSLFANKRLKYELYDPRAFGIPETEISRHIKNILLTPSRKNMLIAMMCYLFLTFEPLKKERRYQKNLLSKIIYNKINGLCS